ncbi:MAG TPA: amidohydrolase family protein [Bacillota bacterium]|jgi:predicted TIM-barrel fold metal-dependent hydrolase|nr:amidohydrolase family protein [Bacillota bacterium]HOL10739.1 amidohydrolase family protein [Bacillota bacterium]HPO98385.1 amidohydrolase family protein [Bacillota bacterium]
MLIDCHTHAFADKIADRAVEQLINYYSIPTSHGGQLADLLQAANQADLDALILLVAATKPEQLKPANDYILDLAGKTPAEIAAAVKLPKVPKIIPFGTFHPDSPDWITEISRLRAAGIKGIKLHPEFQGIDLADPALNPFWEEVAGEFIIMIHVGDPQVSPANMSTPTKVAAIIKNFPQIQIIAAHLGGYQFWEEVVEVLAGTDVYLDTSSALSYIDPELCKAIFKKHDLEKILFGSDYPLRSPLEELQLLDSLAWLTASERELIYGANCKRLLKI